MRSRLGITGRKYRIYLILLIFFTGAASAQLPAPVVQALARAGIAESAIGVYVQEITADQPIISHRAEQPLNPASVMKLVTTYAALESLGPAYTWNTEIVSDGVLKNDVLTGDLVIKGGGDPKFTLENFWLLLRALRARGVREIRGDLVLDRSFFSIDASDPGRFDGDPTQPYNTPPDALLVNFKSFALTFTPDAETRSVRISVDPPLPQVQIVNNLTFNDTACGDWLSRLKFSAQNNADTARLTFIGPYSNRCGEQINYYSLLGHREYAGALFTYLWRDLGGTFSGRVRDGDASANAMKLAGQRSNTLSEIVRDINKYSNNVMARQLFLTLGAAGAGAPGTTEKAFRAVRQLFVSKGLAMPELTMENGSGLSRAERISARGLGQMLLTAFRGATMPEFIASMPLVAVDGTMRRRLANTEVAGQAHIKTGLLTGVRSIAGYVLDAKGRRMVVVFLVNHANAFNAQPAQDALLRWVYARD